MMSSSVSSLQIWLPLCRPWKPMAYSIKAGRLVFLRGLPSHLWKTHSMLAGLESTHRTVPVEEHSKLLNHSRLSQSAEKAARSRVIADAVLQDDDAAMQILVFCHCSKNIPRSLQIPDLHPLAVHGIYAKTCRLPFLTNLLTATP
ncbi:hypothetical protein BJY04DRAFT_71024 [Aspergillus karnatakaensis]|uniref:uncharacterized protein n=1 Tax=Aspergillus karnatakaensis TaxID=1810916 RepID=UPI003CCDB1EE